MPRTTPNPPYDALLAGGLEALLDAVDAPVRLLSTAGAWLWSNRVARQDDAPLSGLSGATWLTAVHPGDRERVSDVLGGVARDGRPRAASFRLVVAGGADVRCTERFARAGEGEDAAIVATRLPQPRSRADVQAGQRAPTPESSLPALEALLAASDDPMALIVEEGRIEARNRAFAKLARGAGTVAEVAGPLGPPLERHVEALRAGQERQRFDVRGADGEAWSCVLRRLHGAVPAGAAAPALLVIRDVRGQRALEHQLAVAEQRLRLAVAAAPMALFHCDRDLVLTWASRPMRGIPPEDLAGRTLVDLYGEQAQSLVDLQREVIRTGGSTHGEVALGVSMGLVRSWECWCEPHRDEAGRVVGVMVVALENTERKAAEAALRRSEERFRGTFDNAGVGVAHVGTDGRILRLNRRFGELLGYPRAALMARRLVDLVEPESHAIAEMAPQGSVIHGRHRFRRKDGGSVWLLLSVSEGGHESREPYSILVAQDVTHQVLADERLQELTATLEQQVTRRTARLERQAEILRRLAAELTTTEQRERKHLAEMLHDHLQQFLVAARLKVGLARRKADDVVKELLVDADTMLGEAVKSARTLTAELRPPVLYEDGLIPALRWLVGRVREQHGLQVELHAEPEAEPHEDHARALVYGAVQELLLNVVKHADTDRAEVSVVRVGGDLRVSVIDQGRGFDVRSLDWDRPPSGFGMVSVRERLTALNGRMDVQSTPGRGTRVDLLVPLREGEPEHLAEARPQVEAPSRRPVPRGGGVRVLLADDHKIVREGLATLLEEQSTIEVVAQAADGQEAVELAGALQPDVVIMDVNMPRMNGIEATRVIKQRWPHINVVGLSVQDETGTATSMREAGASAYLYKGGDPSRLIQTVVKSSRPTPDPD